MGRIKTVLVTGANGYIGANVALYLYQNGFNVIASCRNLTTESKAALRGMDIIQGDLTNQEIINTLLSMDVDIVVHTVSLDHKLSETKSIEDVNHVNVLSTWQLLDGYCKKGIDKFIYLSTTQVLGKLQAEVISETSLKDPENIYALTHSIGEDLIRFYNRRYNTECVSLRLSNGYGAPVLEENNCWWLVINDLCRSAYYKKKIVLESDGSPVKDFIHVKDIAKAIDRVIVNKLRDSLLHVSSGSSNSLLEIAHLVKDVYQHRYGSSIPVYYSSNKLSETAPEINSKYTIANRKLKQIGFCPLINLSEGIEGLFIYFEKSDTYVAKS
ncbi:NAD(P)-dependent oxidoreductase [Daejeonella sp. H1SJ63]|uniref:NAD-dependent epimerase/dehydratase family protein n=1 Tax=Daejeonella sp. H1SJ63 TaxID=3034145 RepID=UPI0023EC3464|nr:NAD(P)-dependent oxidoreductase [Daejeonella sp. H1SJ63]